MRTASTLEQRAAAAGINEFTGFSNSELARRLHLWREDLRSIDEYGGGGSPLLVDDLLIFSCDGASDPFLVALNTRDGSVQWRVKRTTDAQRTFSFATPLLIEVNGLRQIISPGSNMLGAYHPETGRELWKLRFDGYSVIPRPVFGLGLLFIGTGYDRPSAVAVRSATSGPCAKSSSTRRVSAATPFVICRVTRSKWRWMKAMDTTS